MSRGWCQIGLQPCGGATQLIPKTEIQPQIAQIDTDFEEVVQSILNPGLMKFLIWEIWVICGQI